MGYPRAGCFYNPQKGLSGRRTALAPFPRRLGRCFCRLAPSPFCVTGAQGASWPHVAPFSLYKRCGSWSVYLCLDDSPIFTHLSKCAILLSNLPPKFEFGPQIEFCPPLTPASAAFPGGGVGLVFVWIFVLIAGGLIFVLITHPKISSIYGRGNY